MKPKWLEVDKNIKRYNCYDANGILRGFIIPSDGYGYDGYVIKPEQVISNAKMSAAREAVNDALGEDDETQHD